MSDRPWCLEWDVAVAGGCEIAERPVWDERSGSLVWVDVTRGVVHRSAPTPGVPLQWTDTSVTVGATVGAAAVRWDGGLVVAADSAFLQLDGQGRPDTDPVGVDMPPAARFNDAACDPSGRLLAGTTSSPDGPGNGVLWSFSPSGQVRTLLEGLVESNGLAWSSDGAILYYVDSGEPFIRRYSYDVETGSLGQRLPDLAVIDDGDGVPDGLVVDADGAIWVALWGGAAVRRYAPNGELQIHLGMPVSQPTCPGFVGPGLRRLVITTGWEGLTPSQRHQEPWAGHVLTAPVPAAGRPSHLFAGGAR